MEGLISNYMVMAAKFEFFLIDTDLRFAEVDPDGIVKGLNWSTLAQLIEERVPFASFNFDDYGFRFFKETSPQYLVVADGRLKWDSDERPVDSWQRLLTRSFAQLRNNIAHGNKGHLTSPFTHDRTEKFLAAGIALMDFIGQEILGYHDWAGQIIFG